MAETKQFTLRGTETESGEQMSIVVDHYMILTCIRAFSPSQLMEALSQWLNCHSIPSESQEAADYLEKEHRYLQMIFFHFAMAIIHKLAWHSVMGFTDDRNSRTAGLSDQIWRFYRNLLEKE